MGINRYFAKGHIFYTFLSVMGKSEWENRFEREIKKKHTHTHIQKMKWACNGSESKCPFCQV